MMEVSPNPSPIELPTGYYLANFQTILDFVDATYADILNQADLDFSKRFRSLGQDAARLYVRLIGRKGPHFRRDKLRYDEITDLDEAASQLVAQDLLKWNGPQDANSLVMLLAKDELYEMALQFEVAVSKSWRKDAILRALLETVEAEKLCQAIYQQHVVWTPLGQERILIYRLLFFGNLRQDLTEFVLQDLGLLRYETYDIRPEDRLFNRRDLVDHTLQYAELGELAWLAREAGAGPQLFEVCASLPETLGERSLMRRHDKILNEAGRFFERLDELDLALALYERAASAPSRERRSRILDKRGHHQAALLLCEDVLKTSRDEDELDFAKRFSHKLRKKLGENLKPLKRRSHPTQNQSMDRWSDTTIEARVLHFYEAQGIQGIYAENHLWLTLFGLCFWDIIFMSVRGAFFNRFQRGPSGLFSARFYQERETAIQERLQQIREDSNFGEQIFRTLAEKEGVANYFVNWRYANEAMLNQVWQAVPQTHIAAILERLAHNPGSHRNGLPDLLLFDGPQGYSLVEVKGPGDQLQTNQRRWLAYFAEQGIEYRVDKVSWL